MADSDIIRIILVDDHQYIHDAVLVLLRGVPDMRLVGQFYRGQDAITQCAPLKPDLALMDVVMPGMNGIETTRALLAEYPAVRVLGLSSFREYERIKEMLDSGAAGYLAKDTMAEDLLSTIRAVMRGMIVFSREVAQTLLSPPSETPAVNFGLTEREIEVLQLTAKGLTNAEIATAMRISQPTVRFHTNNVLLKLKVETRSEALVLAAKHDLVK
ncbi:MAG: response regulator transcription factor [Chloroflexi bacterium]|nr:response regulator transcription factor [Chloroflexota bacterium]